MLPRAAVHAVTLSLTRDDYPRGAQVVPLPATNEEADRLFHPVHRTRFGTLGRIDGEGWLQAAVWHFRTGKGADTHDHQTLFGYAINVFASHRRALHALNDVKLKTWRSRLAHLPALRYHSTDVRETLYFVFFTYHALEVEAYYQYLGVAPTAMRKRLHRLFSRQTAHLAHLARLLFRARHQTPTPLPTATDTPTATSTPTVVPTVSATARPVATQAPPSTPRPTSTPANTSTAGPTSTPTPQGFRVVAAMSQHSYKPGEGAELIVTVTLNGQPVKGAIVYAQFYMPSGTVRCTAVTDSTGTATCVEIVPPASNGLVILVGVHVAGPDGESADTSTSFEVNSS